MPTQPKRLFRSRTNKVIAGVCGGLGDYFNIDPTIVRLVFVAAVLLWGTGILVYLVMMVVMPLEGTKEVEPNIGARVRESAEEIKQSAQKIAKDFKGTKPDQKK